MIRYTLITFGLFGLLAIAPPSYARNSPKPPARPSILFVVMDDVGIDQLAHLFPNPNDSYDAENQPETPNIDQIASSGVRFGNTWAMPACSTSRAVFFTGRFPFRTNVLGALGPLDLANSMVSPFETTVPKLLAKRGYASALFGKFHLALQGNDPAGLAAPHDLGWDYFAGWLDETGDPSSIDKTAGGVAPMGTTYSCGFVPSKKIPGGADSGACYMSDGSCAELSTNAGVPPGRTCRDQGGILVPDVACGVPGPIPNFETLNSHFVSPVVYNFPDGEVEKVPAQDPRARTFRAKFAVDEAISWINGLPPGRPWMATVSFASDHTPLVQPPVDDTLPNNANSSDLDCSDPDDQRLLSNLMIESLDAELGRLLVQTGLATQGEEGLTYQPANTETMVVVLGDNGSLGTTVKLPFDDSRAKGTAYQTGVWVPLLVAGPLVNTPDRNVSQMVNVADLYALFGEIAGISDVQREVLPRPLDAEPMLAYLENPAQAPIRSWNFTQVGVNLQVDGATYAPCTIGSECTQIPVSQKVCEDNNGVWWGKGYDDPSTQCTTPECEPVPPDGYTDCCQVVAFDNSNGVTPPSITPLEAVAIRNDGYKVVQNSFKPYVSQDQPCGDKTTKIEFYEIDELPPEPQLDKDGTDLYPPSTDEEQQNYDALNAQLEELLASEPECPGDGNIDLVVDRKDLRDWRRFATTGGLSSVYDLDFDGLTNEDDKAIIEQNLGLDCRGTR